MHGPSARSAGSGGVDFSRQPTPVHALIAAGRASLGIAPGPPVALTRAERNALADFALHHGMTAWLPNARSLVLPRETCAADADNLRRHLARAAYGIRDLTRVMAAFRRADIPAVAVRGPAWSSWLYGDPTARQFADLDILISNHRRTDAVRLLESLGYSLPLPATCVRLIGKSLGAWPLVLNRREIDLHWRPAGPRFSAVLATENILRDRILVRLGADDIEIPAPTDAAVLALMHAAKHLWRALELPLSIAWLTRRSDIDWEAVRRVTAKGGALRAAAAGLRIAKDLFGVAVPAPFEGDTLMAAVDRLCACAAEALALPPFEVSPHRLDRRAHRLSFDQMRDRIAYDVRRLLEPTYADLEWVRLPSGVAPLYPAVRLVRLGGMAVGVWKG